MKMADLRGTYESLGFTDVCSYVQTGNLVFDCDDDDATLLAAQIEAAITARWRFELSVFVLPRQEWEIVFQGNPFLNHEPSKLYVTLLAGPPSVSSLSLLPKSAPGDDEFSVSNRVVYLVHHNGRGATQLSNDFFEKKLSTPATTRNWRTITKVFELL